MALETRGYPATASRRRPTGRSARRVVSLSQRRPAARRAVRVLPASAAATPAGSATAAASASVAPPSGEAIKVAQIAAHSGQLAQLGAWDKEALDLAFKEKMDAGGVCGRPLELSVFDDQGDPTVGVNVTRQALETDITAAFATTESAVTLAVIPLFQDAKVPHFTAGQSDAITKEGSAYVFRDGPRGGLQQDARGLCAQHQELDQVRDGHEHRRLRRQRAEGIHGAADAGSHAAARRDGGTRGAGVHRTDQRDPAARA